jgi:hypothetical protein
MSDTAHPWLIATLVALDLLLPAHAHDSWISKGGLRNTAGEWCCGDGDCGIAMLGEETHSFIKAIPGGYEVNAVFVIGSGAGALSERVREFVPYGEAQPSPDGAYWRCKRPNGTRRCFFAPPPSM